MNDPQIWTLIGVITALIFASNRQLSTSIRREMAAGFGHHDAKIDTSVTTLDATVATLDGRIDRLETKMDMRFIDVDHRLESLEGDMRLIKGHLLDQRVTPVRG